MTENICLCILTISIALVSLTFAVLGVHSIISDFIERRNENDKRR